jgi:predicted phosphodiesterase
MKHALISDLHSNIEALTVCVEHARAAGAERFVCLGDCVGYGPDPAPTLALLMSLPGIALVRGNHDEALFRVVNTRIPGIVESLVWSRPQLTDAQLAFLDGAPYSIREGRATYAHASTANPMGWEYVEHEAQAAACLMAVDTPLVFLGHVHVPRVFYQTAGGTMRVLEPQPGVAIPLSPRSRYVINVGSVGQPRDGNNASCYCLYDDTANEVTFHRLPYDFLATGRKIRAAGLIDYFAERLVKGR